LALGAWRNNMPALIALAPLVVVHLVIAIYSISSPSVPGCSSSAAGSA
jgi:hypothetical protein